MGNRAVITDRTRKVGVYLHWCGERSCVEALLKYCSIKPAGSFGHDSEGALAQFVQVARNTIGGSVYVTTSCSTHYGSDNGLYIVEGWKIIKHLKYDYHQEQDVEEHDEDQDQEQIKELMIEINTLQPEKLRLSHEEMYEALTEGVQHDSRD